jgi:L-fuculose-phosphate aldolase
VIELEADLRRRIIELAGLMYANRYIHGRAGNLSARLSDGNILTTPAGVKKADLQSEELVVVDPRGDKMRGKPGLKPTSELPMHLEVYEQRPEVQAVIHAHPIHSIALSLTDLTLEDPYIAEALVLLGPVPTTPYATPSSTENRDAIAGLIADHDAILLAHHGSLTIGRNLDEAYERLEVLEHSAEALLLASQLGRARQIPAREVDKLMRMRREVAQPRENGELAERVAQQVEEILTRLNWLA